MSDIPGEPHILNQAGPSDIGQRYGFARFNRHRRGQLCAVSAPVNRLPVFRWDSRQRMQRNDRPKEAHMFSIDILLSLWQDLLFRKGSFLNDRKSWQQALPRIDIPQGSKSMPAVSDVDSIISQRPQTRHRGTTEFTAFSCKDGAAVPSAPMKRRSCVYCCKKVSRRSPEIFLPDPESEQPARPEAYPYSNDLPF